MLKRFEGGHEDIAFFLVEAGADVHKKDARGNIAVGIAALTGMVALVKYLILEKHVSVDCDSNIDKDGHSIFCAVAMAYTCHTEVMDFFVEHFGRERVTEKPCDNSNLLLHVAGCGQPEMMSWLINKMQADPTESFTEKKASALHMAAVSGRAGNCQVLLSTGKVPVNVRDDNMCTPLHGACMEGLAASKEESQLAVVKVLIEAGADVKAKNNNGLSPVEEARRHGRSKIVEYLARYDRQAEVSYKEDRRQPLE